VNKYPVAVSLVLVGLQYLCALLLPWFMIDIAYRFEGVGSRDEIYMLGGGVTLAVAAAWLPALVCPPVTIVLLFTRFRPRAWIVSGGGLLLGIAVWFYAVSTFEQPVRIGG
jgi:hypothetical protein